MILPGLVVRATHEITLAYAGLIVYSAPSDMIMYLSNGLCQLLIMYACPCVFVFILFLYCFVLPTSQVALVRNNGSCQLL